MLARLVHWLIERLIALLITLGGPEPEAYAAKHVLRGGVIRAAKPGDSKRSSHWPTLRKHVLEKNPCCAVCGGTDFLEVHHKKPFHLHPELELEEKNLIVLCEAPGHCCHLVFGHLLSWHAYNPHVEEDVKAFHDKIARRPTA